MTDTEGYTLTYTFDNLDRPVRMTYPDGTFSETTYDRLSVGSVKDRQGRVTSYEYDNLGQIIKITDAENRILQYIWCVCGEVREQIDSNGNSTLWLRDRQSRVISKRYDDGKGDDFTYDEVGRLKTVTDALGQTKEFTYATDDNLLKVDYVNPLQPTPDVEFTYERVYNRISTMTDGIGTTTYTYHDITGSSNPGAGMIKEVDGPFSDDTLSYQYDVLGRVLNRAVNGDANRQAYVYDILGRVESVQNNLGNFTNDYLGYTAQLTEMTYPNSMKTSFNYLDNMQDRRLESIENQAPGGEGVSRFGYAYDTIGNITQWSKRLGTQSPVTEVFSYDQVDQVVQWDRQRGDLIAGGTPEPVTTPAEFSYGWTYDEMGNRVKEEVTTPAYGEENPAVASKKQVREWSVNGLNQLTSFKSPGPDLFIEGRLDTTSQVTVNGTVARMEEGNTNFQAWIPAEAGDHTEVTVAATANNPPAEAADASATEAKYEVESSGSGAEPEPLTYDANGNTLSAGKKTYLWDGENRLVQITYENSSVTRFDYDGLNRCRRITELDADGNSTSTRTFVWEKLNRVERRAADGKTVVKRYYDYGEGHLKDGNIKKNDTELTFFYFKDHLGSIREMMDYAGGVRSRYDYDPWGRAMHLEGDLNAEFSFTGHYRHLKSGLYLAPFRAYNPEIGRWLNRDPIQEGDGPNLYGYVNNKIITFFDSTGYSAEVVKPNPNAILVYFILRVFGLMADIDCNKWTSSVADCIFCCEFVAMVDLAFAVAGLATVFVLAGITGVASFGSLGWLSLVAIAAGGVLFLVDVMKLADKLDKCKQKCCPTSYASRKKSTPRSRRRSR